MSVQAVHSPGTPSGVGADEGAALEPPDSRSSSYQQQQHQQRRTSTSPPTSNESTHPSPVHLLLSHHHGHHVANVDLSAPYSAPPAPAGIFPPGRYRKLSFSDNHPIVPSPLHTECLKADDPSSYTPVASVATADWSPLRTARPSDYYGNEGKEHQRKHHFPSVAHKDHDDDDDEEKDDDEDDDDNTPTSSTCSSSETAESEHSRTSYESSVLAPISEAPDTSFSSAVSASDSASADTTPTVITSSTIKSTQLVQPSPKHPVVNVIEDDLAQNEADMVTPTNSIIRSRSESNITSSSAVSNSTATNTMDAGNSNNNNSANLLGVTSSSSTNLTRSSSGRRLSCPTKAKVKLRPCFRRRSSAQSPSSAATLSTSFSDCDAGDHPPRGRSVRFSPGPPQEVRTHSPVEYDRKSCAINHRLTAEDVEEMRRMEMGLGLLEAKWAAVAACRAAAADAAATMRQNAEKRLASSAEGGQAGGADSEENSEGGQVEGGCEGEEEAEIKFHSAAGVAGMRRSERHLDRGRDTNSGRDWRWDRSDTGSGGGDSDRGSSTLGSSGQNGQRSGSVRPYSAGSDRDRLVPPSMSHSGMARRGTLSRTNSSSFQNRADYSDSSESEYEGTRASYIRPSHSHGSNSSSSSTPMASRHSVKGNTDAPTASERGHGQGGGNGAGSGVLGGWQPPDRCWNGYSGAAGWAGAGMLGRRSTTPVNGVSTSHPASPTAPSPSSTPCALPPPMSISASSSGPPVACHSSLIARFGLTAPPPPLPGMTSEPSVSTSSGPAGWGHGYASAHSSPGAGVAASLSGPKSPHLFIGGGAPSGSPISSVRRSNSQAFASIADGGSPSAQKHDGIGNSEGDRDRAGQRASSPLFSSARSSSSCTSATTSLSGYDSPASEFCYESGSEYDLLG
ncbi:hypothetical protein CF319_g4255 [Tilletia indica]|nr:hypothetical protein CF319_g4255 [Tilletia indica]